MKRILFYTIILLLCSFSPIFAIKLVNKEINCPICNNSIKVPEIVSYGSYIYHRKSKYDFIYFPYSDAKFIWICPECGYSQLFNHFLKITDKETLRVKENLSKFWTPLSNNDVTIDIRLQQATKVNEILEKDDDFLALFNRILIYHYRTLNPELAKKIASQEITLLESGAGKLQDDKKTRPYLLGEYYRMMNNKEMATSYFNESLSYNLGSFAKLIKFVFMIIILLLIIATLFVWIRKILKLKERIILTVALSGTILLIILAIYFMPRIINHQEYINEYYNGIIQDRMKLLKES